MSRLMGFLHDECERQRGWKVDYLCADGAPSWVLRHASQILFQFFVAWRAYQAAHAGSPYDIINVHEPSAAASVVLKRLLGRPKVVVMTYGVAERAWELDKEEARLGRKNLRQRSRVIRPLTFVWPSRFAFTHADHVFCANGEDRLYLQERLGVPENRVTLVQPGANKIFTDAARGRDYQAAENILFAGTWRHNKGIVDLVKAFELLAPRHPNVGLTILGSGVPVENVLADFAESIRDRVRVIPSVAEPEAAAEFAESDVFVLPSLFEGTPLTLLEAMASGLPIVTTDTCGMKDVIQHGKNGLLVPTRSPAVLADALGQMLDSKELRESLGRRAASDAERLYSWEVVAQPMIAAYQEIGSRS